MNEVYDASQEALAQRNATDFSKYGVKQTSTLSKAEIEVTLQHFECYRRIVSSGVANAVIFEDDVIFKKHFKQLFNCFTAELPTDCDIFYFGKGCGRRPAPMTGYDRIQNILGKKYIFKNKKSQSRFTDSYMVSARAAQALVQNGFPFHLPIDWELNYLQPMLKLNVYWSHPMITFQGSKFGYYKSSIKEQHKANKSS